MRKIIIISGITVVMAATLVLVSRHHVNHRASAESAATKQQQGALNDWSVKLKGWQNTTSTTDNSMAMPSEMPNTGAGTVVTPIVVSIVAGTTLAYAVRLRTSAAS